MAKSPNRLLASLPSDVFSALTPHLKIVELKFGDVLAETGRPIRQVPLFRRHLPRGRTRRRQDDRDGAGRP